MVSGAVRSAMSPTMTSKPPGGSSQAAELLATDTVGEIVPGKENLGHLFPVEGEGAFVVPHECALADSRGSLFLGHGFGLLHQAETGHAGSDRPGGYDDHFIPQFFGGRDFFREAIKDRLTQGSSLGRQYTASYLQDDAPNFFQDFFAVQGDASSFDLLKTCLERDPRSSGRPSPVNAEIG